MTTDVVLRTEAIGRSSGALGTSAVFTGAPAFTSTSISCVRDDWENAKTETVTRWAVCLYTDREDPKRWVTAEVIALPGVASEGATEEEAIDNVREALGLALENKQKEPVQPRRRYVVPRGGRVVYVTL